MFTVPTRSCWGTKGQNSREHPSTWRCQAQTELQRHQKPFRNVSVLLGISKYPNRNFMYGASSSQNCPLFLKAFWSDSARKSYSAEAHLWMLQERIYVSKLLRKKPEAVAPWFKDRVKSREIGTVMDLGVSDAWHSITHNLQFGPPFTHWVFSLS